MPRHHHPCISSPLGTSPLPASLSVTLSQSLGFRLPSWANSLSHSTVDSTTFSITACYLRQQSSCLRVVSSISEFQDESTAKPFALCPPAVLLARQTITHSPATSNSHNAIVTTKHICSALSRFVVGIVTGHARIIILDPTHCRHPPRQPQRLRHSYYPSHPPQQALKTPRFLL